MKLQTAGMHRVLLGLTFVEHLQCMQNCFYPAMLAL